MIGDSHGSHNQSARGGRADRKGGADIDRRKQDRGGRSGNAQLAGAGCSCRVAVWCASWLGSGSRRGGSHRAGSRCRARCRNRARDCAVSDALLLDTHIALWLDSGDDRLRGETRTLIDGCWRSGGAVLLSAVTVWEIALLVDSARMTLDLPVEGWVARFAACPGVETIPLSHTAAARAYRPAPARASRPGRSPADCHGNRTRLSAGYL
jgi:PIN domain nuclease of toxin-antitoxin system